MTLGKPVVGRQQRHGARPAGGVKILNICARSICCTVNGERFEDDGTHIKIKVPTFRPPNSRGDAT